MTGNAHPILDRKHCSIPFDIPIEHWSNEPGDKDGGDNVTS